MSENRCRSGRPPRTLLEQLIWQREATYEEQAEAFARLARELNEPATLSVRHLQRLASGERAAARATPSMRRVMRRLYGHSLDDLLAAPNAPTTPRDADPRELAASAARDSLAFATWIDADRIAPSVVEHVRYELGRIAVEYVANPLRPLLRDLVALRDTTATLLRDRPNPRQSREMLFLSGATCLLLAHASQNLGESTSAMAQARTALTCADQADRADLRAWVRGTQALIAEGSRRPVDAVMFARTGWADARGRDAKVRLAALEARALARTGDGAAAVAALDRAERAREEVAEGDELTGFGGVLTFPLAKQLYYAGGTFTLIGEHERAERAAQAAIELYETGPAEQRSYGDEALARVDVATARLAAGDAGGAASALSPVLDLPAEQRIWQVCDGVARVGVALLSPRYGDIGEARELVRRIETFAVQPVAGPPVISAL